MTTPKKRVAILISGRGANMMSLVEAARQPGYPAEIAVVISNRPEAAGLAWAQAKGIPTVAIDQARLRTIAQRSITAVAPAPVTSMLARQSISFLQATCQ